MNLEDRMTILEEEISMLRTEVKDIVNMYRKNVGPLKHLEEYIEKYIEMGQDISRYYNKINECEEMITQMHTMVEGFYKLEKVQKLASEILEKLGYYVTYRNHVGFEYEK